MEQSEIRQLLQAVAAGERSVEDALLQLKEAPFEDLGFAKLDHHRALRQGAAEVIYGAGKTPEQILKITQAMLHHGQKTVLITRLFEGQGRRRAHMRRHRRRGDRGAFRGGHKGVCGRFGQCGRLRFGAACGYPAIFRYRELLASRARRTRLRRA